MENNLILRKIKYIFDYDKKQLIELFNSAGTEVTIDEVELWLKREEHLGYIEMTDFEIASFLNGFINDKRGKKDGPPMMPENKINNNTILWKLKIALNFKDTDLIAVFKLADTNISKPELTSFFRKFTQPQYRICKDQYMRNFMFGLQQKFKPKSK